MVEIVTYFLSLARLFGIRAQIIDKILKADFERRYYEDSTPVYPRHFGYVPSESKS